MYAETDAGAEHNPSTVPAGGELQVQAPTTEAFIVDVQPSLQGVEFKDYPVTIMDKDGKQVQTLLRHRIGRLTCAVVCLCAIFCLPFAWVPCLMESLKDIEHINPSDNTVVGVYKRI
ncbi:hypothetical protein EMCRGX_G034363 [Ephydatia muelleri]|eukprot:Em0023g290a